MNEGRGEGDSESRGQVPGLSSRYTLLVGVAFIALVVVATLNTLRTGDSGILGTEEVRGERLPEFAVPDIRGELDQDANIAQTACETSERPCPDDARQTRACEIDPEGAIRVCDLFHRPLVLSFWFTTPDECPPTQDAVAAVARRFRGRVNFLSIAVRGDRDEIEGIVSERDWQLPVGWDRDGAVSNIYRVGVCPTVVFAFPGGVFQSVALGDNVNEPALIADTRGLLRESAEREASG
jgi:hypothetical protein